MKASKFVSLSLAILVVAMLFTPNQVVAQPAPPAAPPACLPACPPPAPPPKSECGGLSAEVKDYEAKTCVAGNGTYDAALCICDLSTPNTGKTGVEVVTFCRLSTDESKSARSVHPKVWCDSDARITHTSASSSATSAAINGSIACKRVEAALLKLETPKPEDVKACDAKPGLTRRVAKAELAVKTAADAASAADSRAEKAQASVEALKTGPIAKLETDRDRLVEAIFGAEKACATVMEKGDAALVSDFKACRTKKGLDARFREINEHIAALESKVDEDHVKIHGVSECSRFRANTYATDAASQALKVADGIACSKNSGLVGDVGDAQQRLSSIEAFLAKWQLRGGVFFEANAGAQQVVKIGDVLKRGGTHVGADLGFYLAAGDARLRVSAGRTSEEVTLASGGTGAVGGNAVHTRGSYLPWKPNDVVSVGFSLGTRRGETSVSPASGGASALATAVSPGFQAEAALNEYLAVVFDATAGYEWAAAMNNGTGATPGGLTGTLSLSFVARTPVVRP